ncbi:MAG: LysR family transcriptional regulator [Thermoanaerobacteraceae bacterium]|nr:LysR family transcriptional regulator [Thermoanaerobacteraceae bacterium]
MRGVDGLLTFNKSLKSEVEVERLLDSAMEVRCRLWIEEDGKYIMGDGLYELLTTIDKVGSINKAAEKLSMSYRQAWGKIKQSEGYLGKKLVDTHIGGERGGGTTLTREAKDILKKYSELKERAVAEIQKIFEKEYG